jgi:hypothetical protein
MKESRPVFPVSETTKMLTATAIAIAVILLGSNFTVISAQQQQQLLTTGPGEIENTTTAGAATLFQSTDDSFRIQVPGGWIANDINNTGSASSEETRLGYGLLAQLCSQEEQGAGAPSPDAASAANNATSSNSCQGAQEEVVHVIRYPDLDTRMQPTSNLTQYHLQKLDEVGYRNIQITNTTDRTVNLTNPLTNETVQTLPATFADMTYTTATSANQTRTGFYILTSTNNTAPNATATKGYAVFYESNSGGINTPEAVITPTTASSLPISTQVGQILGSFELIAAPGVAETLEQEAAQPTEFTEETTDDDDEDADDNGGDDDDGDDNGGDDDDGDDNGGDDDDGDDNGGDDNGGDDNGGDDNGGDDNGGDDNGGDDDDGDDNGGDDECIIIGTGNVEDDCDDTIEGNEGDDDGGDDDGGGGGDIDG